MFFPEHNPPVHEQGIEGEVKAMPKGKGPHLRARPGTSLELSAWLDAGPSLTGWPLHPGQGAAWFKKCHFQVTPEIDRALIVRGFLVLGVTLI